MKKIAIVCGHFMPEIGYQETYLARAFRRLGYEVQVFTTNEISPTGRKIIKEKYTAGITTDEKYGYKIQRLESTAYFNSKVVSTGLRDAINKFHPDYAIIIALAKLFPVPILSENFNGLKKIAMFGDADEYVNRTTTTRKIKSFFKEVVGSGLKKHLYTKAVKQCHRIVLNIPETEQFFKNLLSKDANKIFEKKKLPLNLGYDPDNFFFDESERAVIRKQLKVKDDECMIITSTRVNRQKHLEKIIENISHLKAKGLKVHYVIIGFLSDDYEKELKKFISEQKHPEIFHCFGFMNHDEIRKFFNASDVGLWIKAAISIQESMGTGLCVVLENKESVNHLLTEGENGFYFEKNKIEETLQKAVEKYFSIAPDKKNENRKKLAEKNSVRFSYNTIAKKIIEGL